MSLTTTTTNTPSSVQTAYDTFDKWEGILKTRVISDLSARNGKEIEARKIELKIYGIYNDAIKFYNRGKAELEQKGLSTKELERREQEFTDLTEKTANLARDAKLGKFVPPTIEPPVTKRELSTASSDPKPSTGNTSDASGSKPESTIENSKPSAQTVVDELTPPATPQVDKKNLILPRSSSGKDPLPPAVPEEHVALAAFDMIDNYPPVGITNMTATDCFVNSTIQFLLQIPELRQLILDDRYKDLNKKFIDEGSAIIEELRNLFDGYYGNAVDSKGETLTSLSLRGLLPEGLLVGQNDATEVLSHILSLFATGHLQSSFTNVRHLSKDLAKEVPYDWPIDAVDFVTSEKVSSLITDVDIHLEESPPEKKPKASRGGFMGFLFGSSASAEKPKPPETTLEYCFETTLARGEVPEDEIIHFTESTNGKVYASTYIGGKKEVKDLNKHLFVRIKRYDYTYGRAKKITIPVVVPKTFQGKELTAFMQHQSNDSRFGHWVTYVKKADQWYVTSDSNVTPITERRALFEAKSSDLLHYTS